MKLTKEQQEDIKNQQAQSNSTKRVTLTRLSKKIYFHNYFQNNTKNLKRTWEGINDLINRKKKNAKVIAAMKRPLNQGISHDPLENANILNRHFASIGNRLASDLPSSDKSIHNTPNNMRN